MTTYRAEMLIAKFAPLIEFIEVVGEPSMWTDEDRVIFEEAKQALRDAQEEA